MGPAVPLAVYVLLAALHLSQQTGFLGAVAVLFAVNVTLLLPITRATSASSKPLPPPSLHAGWQVPYTDGIAFGVVLQGVELAAALLMGVPALLLEGMSWRQITQGPPASTAGPLAASSAASGHVAGRARCHASGPPGRQRESQRPVAGLGQIRVPTAGTGRARYPRRTPGSAAGASLLRAHNEESMENARRPGTLTGCSIGPCRPDPTHSASNG